MRFRITSTTTTSINDESGIIARQASLSFMYGEIKLAIQMTPASANNFATSPVKLYFRKDTLE